LIFINGFFILWVSIWCLWIFMIHST